jgi:Tfp pilus assembly protein PilO
MKMGLRENFVLVLALVVLCAGYFFVYLPSSVRRNELRADIRLNQRALADLAAETINARELDGKAAQMRREIAHFTSNLPPEPSVSKIVDDFSQAARQNHLTLQRIEPLKRVRVTIYSRQTVRIRLSGDCGNVYQFLQQIEASEHAAQLTQMSLHKAAVDGEVTADLAVGLYFAPPLGAKPTPQTALIQDGGSGE